MNIDSSVFLVPTMGTEADTNAPKFPFMENPLSNTELGNEAGEEGGGESGTGKAKGSTKGKGKGRAQPKKAV